MEGVSTDRFSQGSAVTMHESQRGRCSQDVMPTSELWTDGLICAFECVRRCRKPVRLLKYNPEVLSSPQLDGENVKKQLPDYEGIEPPPRIRNMKNITHTAPVVEFGIHGVNLLDNADRISSQAEPNHSVERFDGSHWVPIGWSRISELVQTVKINAGWSMEQFDFLDDEDDLTVADLAAPYWEHQAGPTWWCHVSAGHPAVEAWLSSAQWLHPAISIALRDESRLISDKMKHLLYEVPVRVAGGLLFELVGQSAGDPFVDDDDIPVVLRSWQAQNFLISALHMKGSASRINILGITEVQELLLAGNYNAPKTIHEVIAHLASRLARWDDSGSLMHQQAIVIIGVKSSLKL